MVLSQVHVSDEDIILFTLLSEKGRLGLHYERVYNESFYAVIQQLTIVVPPEKTTNNDNIKLLLFLEEKKLLDRIRNITMDSSVFYTAGYIADKLKELGIKPLEGDLSATKNAIRIGFSALKNGSRI